jgi:hypothetical protein
MAVLQNTLMVRGKTTHLPTTAPLSPRFQAANPNTKGNK